MGSGPGLPGYGENLVLPVDRGRGTRPRTGDRPRPPTAAGHSMAIARAARSYGGKDPGHAPRGDRWHMPSVCGPEPLVGGTGPQDHP